MSENTVNKRVDYRKVYQEMKKHRRLYLIVLPITLVLSAIYIYSIPRIYGTQAKVAPETENPNSKSALGSLASSFGFDLSNMQSTDAITPLLYPELMDDNGFVSGLFNIRGKSKDGKIDETYYEYMLKDQKNPWWSVITGAVAKLFKGKAETGNGNSKFDPYYLSKDCDDVVGAMKGAIKFSVDKKTGVITIDVKDQDPLICKTIADSVRQHLQDFITRYRTRKACADYEYYKKLTIEAKEIYERSRQKYGSYADANMDILLESFKSKQNDLENDMQLKYNAYSTMNNQLQAAKAKIQERTPAFTLIKGAAVPLKPESPKRMMFIFVMLLLAFSGTTVYIMKIIVKD